MEKFKLYKNEFGVALNCAQNLSIGSWVPFDPANTDYQQFKKDVLEGAELQDADGDVMTQEEAVAFIATLP